MCFETTRIDAEVDQNYRGSRPDNILDDPKRRIQIDGYEFVAQHYPALNEFQIASPYDGSGSGPRLGVYYYGFEAVSPHGNRLDVYLDESRWRLLAGHETPDGTLHFEFRTAESLDDNLLATIFVDPALDHAVTAMHIRDAAEPDWIVFHWSFEYQRDPETGIVFPMRFHYKMQERGQEPQLVHEVRFTEVEFFPDDDCTLTVPEETWVLDQINQLTYQPTSAFTAREILGGHWETEDEENRRQHLGRQRARSAEILNGRSTTPMMLLGLLGGGTLLLAGSIWFLRGRRRAA